MTAAPWARTSRRSATSRTRSRRCCSRLPFLVGVFWGAPLVARELETGSYRLAWTQSVTRRRWSVVRLAMVAAVAVVVVAILTAAITWWQQPLDRFSDTPYTYFDSRDLVPVAYAAFALTLGALLGALLKRTIVAMLATIASFVVVRYLISEYVRPHLIAPLKAISPFQVRVFSSGIGATIGPPQQSDWVVSNVITTGSGRVVGTAEGLGPDGGIGFRVHANGSATLVGVGPCPNRIPTGRGRRRRRRSSAASTASISARSSPTSRRRTSGRCSGASRRSSWRWRPCSARSFVWVVRRRLP